MEYRRPKAGYALRESVLKVEKRVFRSSGVQGSGFRIFRIQDSGFRVPCFSVLVF